MSTVQTPVPVVLAGARGHGRWHLANIRRLQDQGLVRLAGICELTPLTETELALFAGELRPSQLISGNSSIPPELASPSSARRSRPTPNWP